MNEWLVIRIEESMHPWIYVGHVTNAAHAGFQLSLPFASMDRYSRASTSTRAGFYEVSLHLSLQLESLFYIVVRVLIRPPLPGSICSTVSVNGTTGA